MLKKIAAISVLALAPLAAPASQLPDYPFIHATGSASTFARPEIGSIDFEVTALDADPAVARGVVENRIGEIRKLAEEQGVAPDDIATRDVRKEIRKGEAAATVVIYEIKCSVHLEVRDLMKWAVIVGPLVDMQNLDGFATEFSVTDKDAIETELTAKAIKAARRKGEAMAAGAGRKLGAVTALTSGSLKNLGNAMGLVEADFRVRSGPHAPKVNRRDILETDMLKLAQSVDVIFRLK